jgi:hypothetical protein
MRSLVLLLIVVSMTGAAYAQVATTPNMPTPIRLPLPLPPIFTGYTASVIDHSGNVLIFDNSYPLLLSGVGGAATTLPTVMTHVTVISSDGNMNKQFQYDGSMQILGVGNNAVYAFVNSFVPATASPIGGTITRRLVALQFLAGTLPASLPSIDVSGNEDVKLSAGTGAGGSDVFATVQSLFPPVPLGTAPISVTMHTVQLFTFDGLSFSKPITVSTTLQQ